MADSNSQNNTSAQDETSPTQRGLPILVTVGLSAYWDTISTLAERNLSTIGEEGLSLVKDTFQYVGAATGFVTKLASNEATYESLPSSDYRSMQSWIIGRSIWQTAGSAIGGMYAGKLGAGYSAVLASGIGGELGGNISEYLWDEGTKFANFSLSSAFNSNSYKNVGAQESPHFFHEN